MRAFFLHLSIWIISAVGASSSAEARPCALSLVDVGQLAGQSPAEVRQQLSKLLGAPLRDTNRLPDGGTFARLDVADQQDGVSQAFAWGPDGGALEVVFQRGHVQLVSARLEDAEGSGRGCQAWPRETLAAQLGVKRLGKAANTKPANNKWAWLRFEPKLLEQAGWMVRMYCTANGNECSAVSIYFPSNVAAAPSSAERVNAVLAPQPAVGSAKVAAQPVKRGPLN